MRGSLWLVAALVALVAVRHACGGGTPTWRFATFNIQDYPKHARQAANAFAELGALHASAIAVQEITDPADFAYRARTELGPAWQFVSIDTSPIGRPGDSHRLGVLFDTRAWMLAGVRAHDGTRLDGGRWKPTLEVDLRALGGDDAGETVAMLVVHLKSGGDARAIRAAQHAALRAIVGDVRARGLRAIVLGDFNATDDDGDRRDLARLAVTGDLAWATQDLACTAFWDRDDACLRSRLDHVLTWRPARRVRAAGACERAGCEPSDRCPIDVADTSDHCPVVVDVAP